MFCNKKSFWLLFIYDTFKDLISKNVSLHLYTSLERNGTSGHPIDSLQGTMLISLATVLYCGQNPIEQHKKNVYQSSI